MKTRITSLLLVFFLAIMSWQAEAQFTESFDTEIPSDWTVINNDGQDETWQFSDANPFQGAGSANLDYEEDAHDDYLITPQFTVTSGVSDRVSFYATANSTFFVETFDVKLSTTGTEPSDFTEVLGSGTTSTVDYAQFVYSLAAYAGQDVYVAVIGTSTNEFHFYLDEFEVGVAPTCPAPSDLAVENTSAESTDVNWTENGTATEWEVVYDTTGFDPEMEGETITVMNNPNTTIDGLNSNTEYDVYVRSICGEGDESDFSGSSSFTTLAVAPGNDNLCDAFLLTVDEDCTGNTYTNTGATEQTDEPIPECWYSTDDGKTVWFSFDAPESGNVTVTTDIAGATLEDTHIAIYEAPGNCPDLNTLGTEVGCDEDGGDIVGNGYTSVASLSSLTENNTYYIQVAGYSSSEGDFCIEVRDDGACLQPTEITLENITENSVDVSWTDNASATEWEVVYDTVGFDPETEGMSMIDDDGTLGATITDLDPNTEYDVYVRALCGEGDESEFSDSEDFKTECSVIFPDYSEDFTDFVPDCWKEAGSGLPSEGPSDIGSGSWTDDEFLNSGSNSARINLYTDNREDWLISPIIDISGDDYELSYNVGITAFSGSDASAMGSDDEVQVLISEDNGTSWSNLKTYDASNAPDNTGTIENIDLSTYSGAIQIAFWATDSVTDDSEDYNFYIDDFKVRIPPTCLEPSNITVENISANTADVSWTENGTATEWEVVYGTVGFDPETEGMSMIDDDGTLGETITDLDPNTEYDVYVRALCGEGDESEFSDSEDFITECSVISPDYSEGFSEFVPDCWKEAGSGLPSEGPSEFGGSNWIEDDFLNTGSNNSAQINIYFDNRQEWLISPLIDLSGGDYELNYIAAITDYNNSDIPEGNGMGSDDEVQVLITSDNGMTWENLKTYNQADYPSETGDNEVIDLSAYSGTVQIAFWATDGSVNDDEDYDFFIDDFEVTTALSITSNEFNSFAFYPNPAQNVLNLDAQAQIDRVVIHNMLGQKVMERTSNQTQLKLNVADFASGVYFMNVTIDGTQKSFKIIKE